MSLWRVFKYCRLLYLSKPASDRTALRAICKHRCKSLLEIGVGNGQRAQRLIETAALNQPVAEIHYTGIDLFEGRSPQHPGLSLRDAFRQLKATGAQIRLIPGDPYSALSRMANSLGQVDLVLISADQLGANLERAWFYVPRILATDSCVLQEQAAEDGHIHSLQTISRYTVEQLAQSAKFERRRKSA